MTGAPFRHSRGWMTGPAIMGHASAGGVDNRCPSMRGHDYGLLDMHNVIVRDLRGQRFDRLTVIGEAERIGRKRAWLCVCDCGQTKRVREDHLTAHEIRSCRCLNNEWLRRDRGTIRKETSPEYRSWLALKGRCFNSRHHAFSNYGGRGITVCDAWRVSFAAFLSDMGPRPSLNHSIDRIDTNGPYSPSNCRWATVTEQNRNTRTILMIVFNGQRIRVPDLAEQYGVSSNLVNKRLRRGWTIERALMKPARSRRYPIQNRP